MKITDKKLQAQEQIQIISEVAPGAFVQKMHDSGNFPLKPSTLEILQVNMGKMCNQTCAHCHVDAGPHRTEITGKDVLEECLNILQKTPSVHTVDLTGGAPEMNPHFRWFVSQVRTLFPDKEIIVRSNLTVLTSSKFSDYPQFFKNQNVTVVSSLPCYTQENVDKQRGKGVFDRSIKVLKILNGLGYGKPNTGLLLHLVYNPGGPAVAPAQDMLENDYKKRLKEDFGIEFNRLFTITNLPVSRFLEDLLAQNRLKEYIDKLLEAFNPVAAKNVMCTNTLSVGWDGKLYDCDFNQMLELPITTSQPLTVFNFDKQTLDNRNIIINNHCLGCTAGAGSSCQGALV